MSTPKIFKFYLIDADNKYLYQDSEGNIQRSDTERAILDSPANWEDIQIKFGRDEQYWGIFRNSSVALQFQGDGAAILRSLYYANGGVNYNAYCKFVIKKRNDGNTDVWKHQDYFSSHIDFCTEVNDGVNNNRDFFQCRLLESGLAQKIKDNLNTPYEIVEDTDFVNVLMDGIKLQSKDNFTVWQWQFSNRLSTTAFFFPLAYVNSDSAFPVGDGGVSIPDSGITDRDYNAFFKVSKDFEATFNFDINVTLTANPSNTSNLTFKLQLDIFRAGNLVTPVNSATHNIYTSSAFTPGQVSNVNMTGSYTYSMLKGDVITLNLIADPSPVVGGQLYTIAVFGGDLNIVGIRRTESSVVKAIRYDKAVQKLLSLISPDYTFDAGFLAHTPPISELPYIGNYNNAPGYTYLISGDGVRGFAGAKITLRLVDVLQDCWARWMCGLSTINDVFRIDKMFNLLKRTPASFRINEVYNVTRGTATDMAYNQLRVGYQDQDIDKINGRYEVASEQVYRMPVDKPNVETDLQSPFRADMYGIEYVRTEDNKAQQTARDSDKDVFLLEVSNVSVDGNLQLLRYTTPDVISGVYDTSTVYNVGLWPHRFVLRHIPYLRSLLNIPDGSTGTDNEVTFQTGLKNVLASTYIAANKIDESANVIPALDYDGTVQNKIFLPLVYDFEAQPPENLISLVTAKPFDPIEFMDRGKVRGGWILDIGVKPATQDVYQIRLLASPDYELY